MSDSDSESENEKIPRAKKSMIVKFQIEDSSSSSDSNSDNDSDVAGPSNRIQQTKRAKQLNPNTSSESSSDSDCPLNLVQTNVNRKSKALIDESDESTDDSWSPVKNRQSAAEAATNKSSSSSLPTHEIVEPMAMSDDANNTSDSDSSCDSMEKCPICLHAFREQEIGQPNVCEHNFCAPCIEEWSSNVQTCPIDRKPFKMIRIRSRYENGAFVRETIVQPKTNTEKTDEQDFTHCEICNRSDREDIMLLCDGCDAGYHMDCLMPPLTEIPDGSWYCDNCFASETSDDDITQVLAELETFTAPETRLRVRREIVPRITRTRQSERIRSTIRNRRHESQQDNTSAPGPSRNTQTITTTTTTVTSTTTMRRKSAVTKKKVQKRRKNVNRRRRRRRTYVVEYDIDEYNQKFGIKTAQRVIRKRRRKTRKSKKRTTVAGCGRRKNANRSGSPAIVDGILSGGQKTKGLRKEYPTLHLFGDKNALEYFSDESDNDDGIDLLNNSIDGNDGLLIMSSTRSNPHRNLIRRKNVAINSTMQATESSDGIDVLSNIMDSMNRWHSMSRPSTIEKIRINADGSLECQTPPAPPQTPQTVVEPPNAEILNAPMNPRNDGAGHRQFNNSNGFRGNNSNQNAGNFNRFGGRNMQTSFQPFQRAGNFNDGGGGFGNNFSPDNFSPRNRMPFQRQRNNNNNRMGRNQFQPLPQQGLYDGEDISPLPNIPTQSDNDLNERLKSAQPDANEAPADGQMSPSNEENQGSQNVECDSNENPAVAEEPNSSSSGGGELTTTTGEVSSTHEQATVSTTSGVTSTGNYSDSDDADDCPVFEYSVESMQVAKESNDSPESTSNVAEPVADETMENDEDLVQLDDDEHFANETGISDEQANQSHVDNSQTIESPIASPETTATDADFDGDPLNNECESSADAAPSHQINADKDTEDVSDTEADNFEPHPSTATDSPPSPSTPPSASQLSNNKENKKNDSSKKGIEGMDTEMISEDEMMHDEQVSKEQKADKENNNQKSDRDDSFKKVSKSNKDRNYRDKKDKKQTKTRSRRSRSRDSRRSRSSRSSSSSRSRSRNGHRRSDKRSQRKYKGKRQDIQRYDVRTVIADRVPRNYKDKYGRDTSRPLRSVSPRRPKSRSRSYSRSISPGFAGRRRSPSRHRSHSRRRRSVSRRSNSIRRRRSISRGRRSPSRGRRSISRGRRSISRTRRSLSRGRRSFSRSRRSISRGRRSLSRVNRRKKSISRSPVYFSSRSRSLSRGRIINRVNGQSRSRSRSRSSRSYTPKPAHSGAMYHMHAYSRSRSRDKKATKKKATDKKGAKIRSKKKTTGSKRISPFHSPARRGEYTPIARRRQSRSRSKSWNEGGSWNRSLSDVPNEADTSWTPPLAHAPENLTVILKNKDSNKRSKREKKRKVEKRKTDSLQKKDKRKRSDKHDSPALPSKEVFASGDNILVSVSFNKDKQQQQTVAQQQTTIVTLPPTKEQILNKKPTDRDSNAKRSRRTARDAPRKHRKVDIKPVAIIDLDNSPFKEVTPSPRAVIILSDSDHETDKLNKNASLTYSMASNAAESISNDKHHSSIDNREANIRVSTSPPQSPTAESASFDIPLGPKTPPEPSHLVKFSISSGVKTKIVRTVVNPLHDANDDDDEDDDDEDDDEGRGNLENKETNIENVIASTDKVQNSNAQNQPKVGPNTPPGPCSPDVYDPFEPTKSPSQSPSDSTHDNVDAASTSAADDGKSTKPVDLSMALINSKASIDAANSLLSSTLGGEDMDITDIPNDESNVSPYKEKTVDDGFRESAAPKSTGIVVFSNVLLTPAKDTSRIPAQPPQSRSASLTIANLATSTNTISASKQSPLKFTTGSSIISKLPLPKITKPQRHNGNDDNMDIESPYSPGSSDYEDLFEPPQYSPPAGTHSKHRAAGKSTGATTSKTDIFDDLFGSTSPVGKGKSVSKRRPSKHSSSIKDWIAVSKHSTQIGGYGKLNEEQLRILDDVPGSAVELQAKDKLLRKLNRQERVIEEVKLVLKPHYNKKHVTKDEYKEIMRRAVPKICHNRTGEINPKKIKKLIEAYVVKFRKMRKLQQSTTLVIK